MEKFKEYLRERRCCQVKEEDINVLVYDFTGRIISSSKELLRKGLNELTLDITSFSQGNYLIRLDSTQGSVSSQPFSVSK